MYARRGLGSTTTKAVGGATSGATLGANTARQTGSVLAGTLAGGLAAAAPFTGPAAPFFAAAAGLVAPLTKLIQGCGKSCIEATRIVNEAEPRLKALRDEYLNSPTRTVAMQAATLEYMDEVFNWIQNACAAVGGAAGQKCISERLIRGGSAAWCPTRTGCDWITVLRDPVALDRPVADSGGPSLEDLINGAGNGSNVLPLALGAAALFAFALGGDN